MSEISNKQNSNLYIVGVEYVLPIDIATENNSNSRTAITLTAGKSWTPIYFTPGSAKLGVNCTHDFDGTHYAFEFEMNLPGSGDDFDCSVNAICARSIVLALKLSSGTTIIMGGKKKKLRLTSKKNIDTKAGYLVSSVYTSRDTYKFLN